MPDELSTPHFKDIEGYDSAISIDLTIQSIVERNFAHMQLVQQRLVNMDTRTKESDIRIKKIESDFEQEVKVIRLERQAAQSAVTTLQGEVQGKARSLQQIVNSALEEANIPNEQWTQFKPTFDKNGLLLCISKGPIQPPK